ncbi:MAG TPA: hypothetical protein VE987_13120 [Polyangiaceae bacterium]|nr:hypothetical protein [Polyangiaceae bacterium]
MTDADKNVAACEQWVANARADLERATVLLAAIEPGHLSRWQEEQLRMLRRLHRDAGEELAMARQCLRRARLRAGLPAEGS